MSEVCAPILAQSGGDTGAGLWAFLPWIAIAAIFYFLLIRPQMREKQRLEQETSDLLKSLKNGDRIITSGGILGTITAVRDDTVQLRIADAVKIEVLRTSVTARQPEPGHSTESKS